MVAALVTFLMSRRILSPAESLAQAARALSRGDFSQRVKVNSKDEFGELAIAFNAMAEDLERTEQLRRNLVADVAHELRTPLSNIQGHLEAIRDGLLPAEPATFDSIYEEVLLLARLVEDLQELTLAEAGQLTLIRQSADVADIARRAAAAAQPPAEARGLTIETDLPSQPATADVDPERIGQVLRNLLSNAITHTSEGGRITVDLKDEGHELQRHRRRHRRRHSPRRPALRLRTVLPGRPLASSGHRRRWAGPHHRQAAGGGTRRHDRRGKRTGQGQPVHFHSAQGDVASALNMRTTPRQTTKRSNVFPRWR